MQSLSDHLASSGFSYIDAKNIESFYWKNSTQKTFDKFGNEAEKIISDWEKLWCLKIILASELEKELHKEIL